MTPEQQALREAVARALCSADAKKHGTVESVWKIYLPDADAAIAVALETAARVADEIAELENMLYMQETDRYAQGKANGAKIISAAIRAMKSSA